MGLKVSMGSAGRIELHSYSSADIPARDRHEAWVNRCWPSLAPVYRTDPMEPFAVASESFQLGEIFVSYTTITAQRWTRDAATLRSWGPDALVVALTLEGAAHGMMGTHAFRTGPGSVLLSDLGQGSCHVSTASRTILVIIPRPVAAARGLNVAGLHGRVLQSGPAAMLAPHLLSLRATLLTLTAGEGAQLGRTFLDLLVLAVAPAQQSGAPRAGRIAAGLVAREAIHRRLGSPTLTVASLCRELGISRTTLHRLFESEGGVQAYIRRGRLEAVRLALADPAGVEPIHALAERFAFSDAAHLSRLFRTHYGLTPSDHRARSRQS